jgi:hypothetical protein
MIGGFPGLGGSIFGGAGESFAIPSGLNAFGLAEPSFATSLGRGFTPPRSGGFV